MLLQTKNKIYEAIFGLKGLIFLEQNPEVVKEKSTEFILYAALISRQPNITFNEVKEIMKECDIEKIDLPFKLISPLEIQELYKKAVGEIGISPRDFYSMTPQEIEDAYEGYLRKKETEANLFKMALLTQNKEELIRITEEKEYSIGNLEERQAVFKELSIREDYNDAI